MKWIRNLWWSRQRKMDLLILWPECKRLTPSLGFAKVVFMEHAKNDPAWYRYYGKNLRYVIGNLT